jgi:hypothetical protein
MKRILLTASSTMIMLCATAQTPFQMQKQEPLYSQILHERPVPLLEYPAVYTESNPYVATLNRDTESLIGLTRYDLQSNNSMAKRIYVFPDNTIGATFTFGMAEPGFADRGTGYNYFDGASWGPIPTQKIETIRTGWPSIAPFGENGEIIASHFFTTASNYIVFATRQTKGTGSWDEFSHFGPAASSGIVWPRMITSGENNNIIHLLALTVPIFNGGQVYEGLDGAILYSRSSDGGQSWDIDNVLLPGMTSANSKGYPADTYSWASPQGDVLAFSVSDGPYDGFIMKSMDGGDTWEKTIFYESLDNLLDFNVNYGIVGSTDNINACVIDDNGMVHVAVGRQVYDIPGDGNLYYFPYSNGLLYWNESMPPMDTTKVGSAILEPNGAVSPAYLLAEVFDNGEEMLELEVPNYHASLTSMPQLVFDYDEKILYCFYSAITLGYDNGESNYRHIWLRFSDDYGQTWSPYMDLNDNFLNMFNENVYPSASPTVNDYVHVVYQSDNLPGGAVRGENHGYVDNNIVHLTTGTKVGIRESAANVVAVGQIYPNPATNRVNIIVQVDKPVAANISLVNMLGQEVISTTREFGYIGAHNIEFNVSDFKAGIYFVRVQAGNNAVARKLIVQ